MSSSELHELARLRELPPGLMRDFLLGVECDGSLRVLKQGSARRRNIILISLAAAFWNGLIVFAVGTTLFGWLPGWNVQVDPVGVVLFGPFVVLLGLVLIWTVIWRLCGREEWLISTNCLDWHGRLFGLKWQRRYKDAKLAIWAAKGSGVSYLVLAQGKQKWRISRVLYESERLDDLIALGQLLTSLTAWPVPVVEQADD